jgi:hypothetical protein
MDRDAQNTLIAGHVREYGWHCLHVAPETQAQQAFTYSIGFAQTWDAPEVLVFGAPRDKAHALLSRCATRLREGHRFVPGEPDASVLTGGYRVVFRRLARDQFGEYVGTAERYHGDRAFDALVMFLPDRANRFPWEADYAGIDAAEAIGIVEP